MQKNNDLLSFKTMQAKLNTTFSFKQLICTLFPALKNETIKENVFLELKRLFLFWSKIQQNKEIVVLVQGLIKGRQQYGVQVSINQDKGAMNGRVSMQADQTLRILRKL